MYTCVCVSRIPHIKLHLPSVDCYYVQKLKPSQFVYNFKTAADGFTRTNSSRAAAVIIFPVCRRIFRNASAIKSVHVRFDGISSAIDFRLCRTYHNACSKFELSRQYLRFITRQLLRPLSVKGLVCAGIECGSVLSRFTVLLPQSLPLIFSRFSCSVELTRF